MLTFMPVGHPIIPIGRIGLDVVVASFFCGKEGIRLCLPTIYRDQAIAMLADALGCDRRDIWSMAFDDELPDVGIIRRIVDIGARRPLSERALVAEMMNVGTVYIHSDIIGTLVIDMHDGRMTITRSGRSVDILVPANMPRYMSIYRAILHMASSIFEPRDLLMTEEDVRGWIDERMQHSLFAYDYLIPGA